MQRTVSSRRRPLVSVILGLASAALLASTAGAVPLQSNTITVFAFGSGSSLDLAGVAAVNGIDTRGDLLLASDGNLYVATSAGGAGSVGAVLRISPSTGTSTLMHALVGGTTEGISPYAGLIQAADGNLYGTTFLGGTASAGTVYKLGLDGTFATLYNFNSQSGGAYEPYTAVVQAPDGALYGTTLRGGTANLGTVYKLTLAGTLTILHSFTGSDGSNPEGALVVGVDGALYGTTLVGGANDRGVIYKVTTSGTYTTVYTFPALGTINAAGVGTNVDGANPRAGLILGQDGNFYGTAYQGGASGYGTIYRITPAGVLTVVHNFGGAPTDGAYPLDKVTQDTDGTLYGTTELGGYSAAGVAWRITPSGTYSLLHSFTNSPVDGGTPYTTLLPLGGYLYGVSFTDLLSNAGAVYKLDLGTAGVLPVTVGLSAETIAIGSTTTLTWSSPTAAGCLASGAWSDTIGTSGTSVLTPTAAGIYRYILTCTDGAGVVRNAYAELVVTAPVSKIVDGGSTGGGGALSWLALGLLGGAAGATARRRYKSTSV